MPSIDEVEATDAGAHLFNGITRMNLVDRDGHPLLFSARRRLARQVIGLFLEAGITPEDLTSRMFKINNRIGHE